MTSVHVSASVPALSGLDCGIINTETFADGSDEAKAWADMLAKVGGRLCGLLQAVERYEGRESARRRMSVVHELSKERARLARELHAGAGQPLSGIKLNLEILHEGKQNFSAREQQALGRLETLTEQALQQLRAVSHRLHPPAWQQLPLSSALRQLVEVSGIGAQFELTIDVAELPFEPEHAAKLALYRCAQECLSNIVRHSGATKIQLILRGEGDRILLAVSDNGHGFSPGRPSKGIGVRAIEEHSTAVGGTCRIQSGADGTTVKITIPVDGD